MDDQFTEDSGVADFNEQVWRVLRERGHLEQIASMTAGLTIQTTTRPPLAAHRPMGRTRRDRCMGDRIAHAWRAASAPT